MRVNIYAEEMTNRLQIISKEIEGQTFTGLRFYLELPATVDGKQYQGPFMHHPNDDDSSAVTFWGKKDLRVMLKKALEMLDVHYAYRDGAEHREAKIENEHHSISDEVILKVAERCQIAYRESRSTRERIHIWEDLSEERVQSWIRTVETFITYPHGGLDTTTKNVCIFNLSRYWVLTNDVEAMDKAVLT